VTGLCWIASAILCVIQADGEVVASSADRMALRDGSVVLGQVVDERVAFGGTAFLVRRSWADGNVPSLVRQWTQAETLAVRKARRERKERLNTWRRDRSSAGDARDDVSRWITREMALLSTLNPPRTPLMKVSIPAREIQSITRQNAQTAQLLRFGWLASVKDVESLSIDELTETLELKGEIPLDDPAAVDGLLPLYPESDATWRMRRAATEVALEPGLRFVQFRQFVLAESGPSDSDPDNPTALIDSPAGLEGFGAIQAVSVDDPLRERFALAESRGRIGLVMSRVSFSIDSDRADADTTLWVRQANGRWASTVSKSGSARTNERADPQIDTTSGAPLKTALLILESVAAQPSSPEESRIRQRAGTAGERALARARDALWNDLQPVFLPIPPSGR
jgi:hypothetical protein